MPGTWTLAVRQGGRTLAEKSFTVVDEPAPSASTLRSIELLQGFEPLAGGCHGIGYGHSRRHVVDGSGSRASRRTSASRTAASSRSAASDRRRSGRIDADGLIVAPGFIDGHTHMDAQVAWDPLGSCSCWHGVTTVIMGNCGFALAPCKPEEREWFARCLTAVEDIPTEAMLAGIDWTWETFPEYLATVDRLPKAINYGAYIGHSALRMYVMGERALTEKATEDDLARMARGGAGGDPGRRHGLLELARHDPRHAGRHAGGQPHRRLVGGRPPRRRHGRAERRHLPGRAGHRRAARRSAPSSPG